MANKINNQLLNSITNSGKKAPISGYYSYDGHVGESCNAFVPPQANKMASIKGETLPTLGSCNHWIRWKLIEVYVQ